MKRKSKNAVIKSEILEFVFDQERVASSKIADYLYAKYNITNKSGVNRHLRWLENNNLIKSDGDEISYGLKRRESRKEINHWIDNQDPFEISKVFMYLRKNGNSGSTERFMLHDKYQESVREIADNFYDVGIENYLQDPSLQDIGSYVIGIISDKDKISGERRERIGDFINANFLRSLAVDKEKMKRIIRNLISTSPDAAARIMSFTLAINDLTTNGKIEKLKYLLDKSNSKDQGIEDLRKELMSSDEMIYFSGLMRKAMRIGKKTGKSAEKIILLLCITDAILSVKNTNIVMPWDMYYKIL